MKRRIFSLLVRHFLLVLAGLSSLRAEALPPAPVDHIYDPDFLISRKVSTDLSVGLDRFQAQNNITVYLALFSSPPQLIGETAAALNQAWNQSGYGVLIAFAPPRREVCVLPSPQLSLEQNGDALSKIFREAAQRGLARGDYSAASVDGTSAVMEALLEMRSHANAPASAPGWHPRRRVWLALFGAVAFAGVAVLWVLAGVWRSANLFDHRYRFPEPKEPAALRFGATRCGGQMATINFGAPLKAKDV
jgi:hypothetical protein